MKKVPQRAPRPLPRLAARIFVRRYQMFSSFIRPEKMIERDASAPTDMRKMRYKSLLPQHLPGTRCYGSARAAVLFMQTRLYAAPRRRERAQAFSERCVRDACRDVARMVAALRLRRHVLRADILFRLFAPAVQYLRAVRASGAIAPFAAFVPFTSLF